jgi:hypothetical protein
MKLLCAGHTAFDIPDTVRSEEQKSNSFLKNF